AGPDSPVEMIERVAEAVVTKVRRVEDDAEPLDLLQQLASADPEVTRRARAVRVHARTVVRRPHRPQPLRVRAFEVSRSDERVRALETEDIADRPALGAPFRPGSEVGVERTTIRDWRQLAALLHRPVPGELPLGLRPCLLLRVPPRQRVANRDVASD